MLTLNLVNMKCTICKYEIRGKKSLVIVRSLVYGSLVPYISTYHNKCYGELNFFKPRLVKLKDLTNLKIRSYISLIVSILILLLGISIATIFLTGFFTRNRGIHIGLTLIGVGIVLTYTPLRNLIIFKNIENLE